MDSLFATFTNSLTALSLCIVVGFICRKRMIITDEHVSGLAEVLVKVGMPSTIFISMMRPFTMSLLLESTATFVITGLFYLIGGAIALGLARTMKASIGERQAWVFGMIFGNVGFMGLPVIYAVFGYDGMIYASMANASFNVLAFTIGVRIYGDGTRKGGALVRIIKTPALVATFFGMIFFVTGLRLPSPLENGVTLLGGLTTPISLIIVGTTVARQRIWDMFKDWRFYPAVGLRLLVLPVLTVFVLRPFLPELMLGVIVTLVAMPAAALTVVFAEQGRGDTVSAVKIVILSTILCVVTVPLISFLL